MIRKVLLVVGGLNCRESEFVTEECSTFRSVAEEFSL